MSGWLVGAVFLFGVLVAMVRRLDDRHVAIGSASKQAFQQAYTFSHDSIHGVWSASVTIRRRSVHIEKFNGAPTKVWVSLLRRLEGDNDFTPPPTALHIEVLPMGMSFIDTKGDLDSPTQTPQGYRALVEEVVRFAEKVEAEAESRADARQFRSTGLTPEKSRALVLSVKKERAELEARKARIHGLMKSHSPVDTSPNPAPTELVPLPSVDPLAFLPEGNDEGRFSEKTNNPRTGAKIQAELKALKLVVIAKEKGATEVETINLDEPFRVFLSFSHEEGDKDRLHVTIRQHDGDWTEVGLSSSTSGFTSPVDHLPNMRTDFPIIEEDNMQKLLALLREAMAWHGAERWL